MNHIGKCHICQHDISKAETFGAVEQYHEGSYVSKVYYNVCEKCLAYVMKHIDAMKLFIEHGGHHEHMITIIKEENEYEPRYSFGTIELKEENNVLE
jgi:hypothetical protein